MDELTKIPDKITDEIIEFCKEICADSRPLFLHIKRCESSVPLDCYENVDRYIQQNGGDKQYGWRIYIIPGKMLEAEFHCVCKINGHLIDISPSPLSNDKILFLPDTKKIYDGFRINNIRKALNDDDTIKRFISINDMIFYAENQGVPRYENRVVHTQALDFLYHQAYQIIEELRDKLLKN